MKQALPLILISISLSAASAHGLSSRTAVTIDGTCRELQQDPQDLGWRFKSPSKFAGQCVNAKSVRPVNRAAETDGIVSFGGFFHEDRFWNARWDVTNQPRVIFELVHFESGLPLVKPAHTELRFSFQRPIELISTDGRTRSSTREVIISWEAVFPNNVPYNMLTGLRDNFAIAGRALSLEARVPENLLPDGHLREIEQYPLSLSPEESVDLFRRMIFKSSDWDYAHFYGTLFTNCTTELFRLLDITLSAQRSGFRSPPFRTGVGLDPIIGPSRRALQERGLIEAGPMETLGKELGR